jgi:hypothetical protein
MCDFMSDRNSQHFRTREREACASKEKEEIKARALMFLFSYVSNLQVAGYMSSHQSLLQDQAKPYILGSDIGCNRAPRLMLPDNKWEELL